MSHLCNAAGILGSLDAWSPSDAYDLHHSVAWGDVDGDGDLDLALGASSDAPEKIYLNDNGVLQTTVAWQSSVIRRATSSSGINCIDFV